MEVSNAFISSAVVLTNVLHADGAGSYLVANGISVQGTNTTRAILCENTATVEAQGFHADSVANGWRVEATGGTLSLGNCQLTNCAGTHLFLGNSALVTCIVNNCYFNDAAASISIGALVSFDGNYESSDTARPGFTVIGELWAGVDPTEQIPLITYTRETASSGWTSGLAPTDGGGLTINVAAGDALVNTGTGVLDIIYAGGSIAVTDDSDFWIFITSAGVLSQQAASPDHHTNILVANGISEGGDIMLLADHRTSISQIVNTVHEWTGHAVGNVWVSGLATTIPGGSMAIDVDSGTFYNHSTLETATGTAPITFTTWYNDGAWKATKGVALLSNTQYNNFGVGLANIPGGEFAKHAVYVVSTNGGGTQFHVVYAPATYGLQADAESATPAVPPAIMTVGGITIAGVVVQQGNAAPISIVDTRPAIQLGTAGTAAAVPDHGALAGLGDDDHSQYGLLSGDAIRNPITGEYDFTGGTLTIPVAIAPAQTKQGSAVWNSTTDEATIGNGAARITVADTTTAQILTNKTLTTPTVGDFTNATHDHTNNVNGGLLGATIYTQEDSSAATTSFTDNTQTNSGLSITADAALAGTNVLVQARYEATFSNNNQIAYIDIAIDGTKVATSQSCSNASINESDAAATFVLPAVATGEVITMRWWTNTGKITVGERMLMAARQN